MSEASAGLRPCHSPPGGLGVTASEEQIRTSSLCPSLMVKRVTAEARVRQRGGSSSCDPGLPGSGHACRRREDLGLPAILPVVFLEPLKLYMFSLAVMAFSNLYFQQLHYTAPRGVCVCVCVCVRARLFLGFVVLLELLLDVSPMFWKPASLHLLKHSAPSPSPPL